MELREKVAVGQGHFVRIDEETRRSLVVQLCLQERVKLGQTLDEPLFQRVIISMFKRTFDPRRKLGENVVSSELRFGMKRSQRRILGRTECGLEELFDFWDIGENFSVKQDKWRIRARGNVGQLFWLACLVDGGDVEDGSLQPKQHEQPL